MSKGHQETFSVTFLQSSDLYKFGSYSLVKTVPVKLLKLLSNNICRYDRMLFVLQIKNINFRA